MFLKGAGCACNMAMEPFGFERVHTPSLGAEDVQCRAAGRTRIGMLVLLAIRRVPHITNRYIRHLRPATLGEEGTRHTLAL